MGITFIKPPNETYTREYTENFLKEKIESKYITSSRLLSTLLQFCHIQNIPREIHRTHGMHCAFQRKNIFLQFFNDFISQYHFLINKSKISAKYFVTFQSYKIILVIIINYSWFIDFFMNWLINHNKICFLLKFIGNFCGYGC